MQQLARHDLVFDEIAQRLERLHRTTAPIDERAVRDIRSHARQNLDQTIEGEVVVEFGDQDVGEQPGAGHAARDGAGWRRRLNDLLAAPAGFFQPGNLDDLQLGHHQVEHVARGFAHKPQGPAAGWAGRSRIEFTPLARCRARNAWTAAGFTLTPVFLGLRRLGSLGAFDDRRAGALSRCDEQVFQGQLQLRDLTLDLLGRLSKDLLL